MVGCTSFTGHGSGDIHWFGMGSGLEGFGGVAAEMGSFCEILWAGAPSPQPLSREAGEGLAVAEGSVREGRRTLR